MNYKRQAWEQLKTRYWIVFVVFFLAGLVLGAASYTFVGAIILAGPITVGLTIYVQKIVDDDLDGNHYEVIWKDGFNKLGDYIVLSILKGVFIFLWSLLFIVPGIIKSFSFAMAEWIIAKNPGLKPTEALKLSQEMMNGHKGDAFLLGLSFIGWYILCILTLGIGFLFLQPYLELTFANFYKEIYDSSETIEIVS